MWLTWIFLTHENRSLETKHLVWFMLYVKTYCNTTNLLCVYHRWVIYFLPWHIVVTFLLSWKTINPLRLLHWLWPEKSFQHVSSRYGQTNCYWFCKCRLQDHLNVYLWPHPFKTKENTYNSILRITKSIFN